MKPLVLIGAVLLLTGCVSQARYDELYAQCQAYERTTFQYIEPDEELIATRCKWKTDSATATRLDCDGCNLPVVIIPRY